VRRANAALNVFHIGGAFLLQEAFGWIVDRWPAHAGQYPPIAYRTALVLMMALQLIALLWFAHADRALQTAAGELRRLMRKTILDHA
jgi:hypothetical protein